MIRVVIADDSALLRSVLTDLLESTKRIEVVGVAINGKEAVELVKRLSPDVLILDCEMPVMNGLEALRRIMDECPLPVFMFSSLTAEGSSVTLKALEYGAVDYLLKPTKGIMGLNEVSFELVKKIEYLAIRYKYRKLAGIKGFGDKKAGLPKSSVDLSKLSHQKIDIVAIGSSTGGVQAAVEIVKRLPSKSKPIVWVQHMPPNFTFSFAQRLDSLSAIKVKEAEDNDELKENTCYIARGGVQMRLVKRGASYFLKVGGEEKVSGHCPSCNVLFNSVSEYFTSNALGVILTGMGDDGTKGLVSMHDKGSYVIGQDEQSCVVYGMPKAAYKAGAVDVEVDISHVAQAIVNKGGAG